jgi:hypothetical protein
MGTFAAEKGLYLSYAIVAQLNYSIDKVRSALKKLAKAHGEGFVLRDDVEIALSDVEPLLCMNIITTLSLLPRQLVC